MDTAKGEWLIRLAYPEKQSFKDKQGWPVYKTNVNCVPSKYFHGHVVVSMRPISFEKVVKAIQISSNYPAVHDGPIHICDPKLIGIDDINKTDYGL